MAVEPVHQAGGSKPIWLDVAEKEVELARLENLEVKKMKLYT